MGYTIVNMAQKSKGALEKQNMFPNFKQIMKKTEKISTIKNAKPIDNNNLLIL